MKRYLIVTTSSNEIINTDDISEYKDYLDDVCMESEIIDLDKGLFYRPCGWLKIEIDESSKPVTGVDFIY